jgi:hypothetical protein
MFFRERYDLDDSEAEEATFQSLHPTSLPPACVRDSDPPRWR